MSWLDRRSTESRPKWVTFKEGHCTTFLPYDLDRSSLIRITMIGDVYAKYLNTETDKILDCQDYYNQYLAEIGQGLSSPSDVEKT